MSNGDLFGAETPNTRDRIAPEPEIYLRAQDAEKDLDKVSGDLAWAERDLKMAAERRDQLLVQIAEQEAKVDGLKGDIAADTLLDASLSNKEKRDLAVASALRRDENYSNHNKKLQTMKTDLRNAATEYELATGRVKSLHRRVDAAVSKARLIGAQLSTLGHLLAFDTAKLQMGAIKK